MLTTFRLWESLKYIFLRLYSPSCMSWLIILASISCDILSNPSPSSGTQIQ